ncbi:MAG: hypothetical protein ABIO57_01980 [Candidatus Paceibacterota bacterium]
MSSVQTVSRLPGSSKTTAELKSFLLKFYSTYKRFNNAGNAAQQKKFNEIVVVLNRVAKNAKLDEIDSIYWNEESLLVSEVFMSSGDARTAVIGFYRVYRITSWGDENDAILLDDLLQSPLLKL